MAKLIKTSGEVIEVSPKNGNDFSLEELRALVGCSYIEIAYPRNAKGMLVIDEEGKLVGKSINHVATMVYGYSNDCIVGDALLCEDGEVL